MLQPTMLLYTRDEILVNKDMALSRQPIFVVYLLIPVR